MSQRPLRDNTVEGEQEEGREPSVFFSYDFALAQEIGACSNLLLAADANVGDSVVALAERVEWLREFWAHPAIERGIPSVEEEAARLGADTLRARMGGVRDPDERRALQRELNIIMIQACRNVLLAFRRKLYEHGLFYTSLPSVYMFGGVVDAFYDEWHRRAGKLAATTTEGGGSIGGGGGGDDGKGAAEGVVGAAGAGDAEVVFDDSPDNPYAEEDTGDVGPGDDADDYDDDGGDYDDDDGDDVGGGEGGLGGQAEAEG